MSFVDREIKRSYVITYKELIFLIVVFTILLIVLYPKDMLKEQIMSESSNYDLSMLYLESLLKHSPEDESLMLILAEQSLRSGKKDLSLKLLNVLKYSKNREYRDKATLLNYKLEKENYYYIKDDDKDKLKAKKELLRRLFLLIYNKKMYPQEEVDKWYQESIFLDEKSAMYYFVKLKLQKEPTNIDLLEKAYYLSIYFSKKRESYTYVKLLQKYDTKRVDKWGLDEYYMLLRYKQYTKVRKLLEIKSENSDMWKEKLAGYYLMRQMYIESSEIYMLLSNNTQEYSKKRDYLFKAIEALQAGNRLKLAAKKAHKYEKTYMNDIVARKFFLKLYISTGNLDYASSLSKRILKRGDY